MAGNVSVATMSPCETIAMLSLTTAEQRKLRRDRVPESHSINAASWSDCLVDYGSEGWAFESLGARHLKPLDGKAGSYFRRAPWSHTSMEHGIVSGNPGA
jgi:hypothetical protein